jgi:serine/threonine-protein kinase
MEQPQGGVRPLPRGSGFDLTTPYRGPDGSVSRCRVAGDRACGSAFQGELASLLLRRLRTVTLIALLPSLLFLVRGLIEAPPVDAPASLFLRILHGLVTLLLAGLAAFLWSRKALCLRVLRGLELALFVSLAVFFGWGQYCLFHHVPETGLTVDTARLRVIVSTVRWVLLVIIYGVFIPNTWRRCAVVVGIGTALPLLLTPLGAWAHGQWQPELNHALLDMAILLLTAAAVAVFGSWRFQMLEQAAFRAQQLGQYRLERRLGSGGMGEVYLAEHVLLRRPCAIKLIRPEQAGDPTTLQRFEREVQAMATLTHPNTALVFDYGHADDGTFYYVMEYLPGQNLENLVAKHGPLPPARAIHFLRQVCLALREAHGIGLLHRDIKPSNIISCERGGIHDVAKLLDFGLVQDVRLGKDAARLTMQGTVLGSPPYMSPEQAAGRADVGRASDIYSLGAVGYYLLLGQPPFPRETAMQILMAHAYEVAVPPRDLRPEIPADLEAVLLRCLQKKPADRYPSAEALEQALAVCHDAGAWTEEKAAAWWRQEGALEETVAHPALNTATPR